jgi:hypothetical protein
VTGQPQLFYEDVFDVARAAVQAAGGTKIVAGRLWPHMPISEAQRKLLDCLNRERAEKLCIEEFIAVLRMAREAGFHQAKHWIDDAAGYQPTPPQDPKIERDRLADELARAADHFKTLTRAAERLLEPSARLSSLKA